MTDPAVVVQCFGALLFAKLLSIPIVMSYHTHVPKYIPQYTFSFLVEPMWAVISESHPLLFPTPCPLPCLWHHSSSAELLWTPRLLCPED